MQYPSLASRFGPSHHLCTWLMAGLHRQRATRVQAACPNLARCYTGWGLTGNWYNSDTTGRGNWTTGNAAKKIHKNLILVDSLDHSQLATPLPDAKVVAALLLRASTGPFKSSPLEVPTLPIRDPYANPIAKNRMPLGPSGISKGGQQLGTGLTCWTSRLQGLDIQFLLKHMVLRHPLVETPLKPSMGSFPKDLRIQRSQEFIKDDLKNSRASGCSQAFRNYCHVNIDFNRPIIVTWRFLVQNWFCWFLLGVLFVSSKIHQPGSTEVPLLEDCLPCFLENLTF